MNRFFIYGMLIALVLQLGLLGGCDKVKIPGNVAGQVMTEAGVGRGYMVVALFDQATGQEVQRTQSEDGGNYFLEKVPAGEYTIKIFAVGGEEYKTDAEPFKLGLGKTETINITLLGKAGSAGEGEAGGGDASGGEGGY